MPVTVDRHRENRIRISFFIDPDLDRGLDALQRAYGVPKAESIRRAIARYLEEQRVRKGGKQSRKQ